MLLPLTIVLVLIATVLLVVGVLSQTVWLIFTSIGVSIVAGAVLFVLSQANRRSARADAAGPSATDADASPAVTPPAQAPAVEAAEPTRVAPAAAGASAALPIGDYDSLRVNEILPRLADLDADELETVAQHEESTKNRTTVLNRIDDLLDQLEGETGSPAATQEATTAVPALDDEDASEAYDEDDADDETPSGFPVAGYASMSADEAIAAIADLDADELETVAVYEEANANRDDVLDAIDDRLDLLEGVAPAPAKKSAGKKAAAKKATGKKAAAGRTGVAKKAAASRKGATKKASAAKATSTRAASTKASPVKKAAVRKASATKATSTKKAAKKAAGTRKAR